MNTDEGRQVWDLDTMSFLGVLGEDLTTPLPDDTERQRITHVENWLRFNGCAYLWLKDTGPEGTERSHISGNVIAIRRIVSAAVRRLMAARHDDTSRDPS